MKKVMKLFSLLLVFAMLVTLLPSTASAESKDNIPTKVRLFEKTNERAIFIELADATQTIDNIKTNSKNLYAMLTGFDKYYEEGIDTDEANNKNSYYIGLRSKKDGSYTVSFDILDKSGKKVETKKIKVYAYGSPVKSVTFDGKKIAYNKLTGKSAKVKVTLNKDNKIDKLEYGVYKIVKDGDISSIEEVYKSFKNGSKITFGTEPYYYSSGYSAQYSDFSYQSKYFSTGMDAPTYIKITYNDKYTKQNETYTLYYSKEIE